MRGVKYSFEQVKKEFEKRGYELLETEYVRNTQKMRFRCPKHPDKETSIMFKSLLAGNGCKYCAIEKTNELNRYDYNFVKSEFDKRGYILLDKEYKNSKTPLRYICKKHPDKVNTARFALFLADRQGCKWCAYEKRKGKNSNFWKGGLNEITEFLREQTNKWKMEWLEKHGYKCDITNLNSGEIEVHHAKPFHVIRDEVINQLGFQNKKFLKDYTQEELDLLIDTFRSKHDEIVGIPIHKDLHKLFHRLYGFQTTLEDYQEFKQRYLNGEFHVESIEKWKRETAERLKKKKVKPKIVYKGLQISLAEASKITGINLSTLHERYKRGIRGEELFRPVRGVGGTKFSVEDVKEIKEMLAKGIKQTDIAKKFGVSISTITHIKQGKSWKYEHMKEVAKGGI